MRKTPPPSPRLLGAPTNPPRHMLELTANPADGWAFTGWIGDVISTTNSVSLLMDGDKQVTAVFSERSHSIYLPVVLK